MGFDPDEVAATFRFDQTVVDDLRARWGRVMDLAVWGDIKSERLGAVPRLRKRILELGENLRSLTAGRDWVPHPREQVKSAMGASLKLRDSLLDVERAAQNLSGGNELPRFEAEFMDLRQRMLPFMEHHESQWGALLEAQYGEDPDEHDEEEDPER